MPDIFNVSYSFIDDVRYPNTLKHSKEKTDLHPILEAMDMHPSALRKNSYLKAITH